MLFLLQHLQSSLQSSLQPWRKEEEEADVEVWLVLCVERRWAGAPVRMTTLYRPLRIDMRGGNPRGTEPTRAMSKAGAA